MEVSTNEISGAACDGVVGDVTKRDIRIWMDGAFDMMHYGHMNAFRQAKALGKLFRLHFFYFET
jgi:bifunctional ADP-heptose synthase (sugar kinase/adenylyltransferase)